MKNDKKNESNKKQLKVYSNLFVAVFCCFLLFFAVFLSKSTNYLPFLTENLQNYSFQVGEELKYKISYGKSNKNRGPILAGYATLMVQENKEGNYVLKAYGKTTKLFALFMKVRHQYESIVDRKTLNALEFKMDIEEGKFFKKDSIEFKQATNNHKKTNDIVSILYKLRSIKRLKAANTDTIFFSYYYNGEDYESYIINMGTETIKTKLGKQQATKWSPLLEKGRVFKDTTGAFIWTSSEPIQIPLKLEIPILVGSIYVNIVSAKGTIYDISK